MNAPRPALIAFDEMALQFGALIGASERLLKAEALRDPNVLSEADVRAMNDSLIAIKEGRKRMRAYMEIKTNARK